MLVDVEPEAMKLEQSRFEVLLHTVASQCPTVALVRREQSLTWNSSRKHSPM